MPPWLDRFEQGKKKLILNRVAEIRGGKLNDSAFGTRMTGSGTLAEQIAQLLDISKRRSGLDRPRVTLSTAAFQRRMRGRWSCSEGVIRGHIVKRVFQLVDSIEPQRNEFENSFYGMITETGDSHS